MLPLSDVVRPLFRYDITVLLRRQLLYYSGSSFGTGRRIHAELTKLGFVLSEITVSRYLPRRPVERDQVKRWIAFLLNHKDDIAAMDLFTIPTASLRLLYGFFIIEHGRRRILHFNAAFHPTAAWVIQQLRDAFPYESAPKYLIFDRDSIYGAVVVEFIKAMGTKPVRISYRGTWQTQSFSSSRRSHSAWRRNQNSPLDKYRVS